MTPKTSYLICGLAFAAVIAALPAANSIAASNSEPAVQVNRSAKGDRLVEPSTLAVKKSPVQPPAPRQPAPIEQTDKRQILDGCEPSFSPVTVPSMAHIAGRCVG